MESEALKLALEALKEISRHATTPWEDEWCGELADETLTAINALAQPAQEPVCPECKAGVLYECVACSSNNYPPQPEQASTNGLHTCPYAEEIHGDYEALCDCDEEATHQCARDI